MMKPPVGVLRGLQTVGALALTHWVGHFTHHLRIQNCEHSTRFSTPLIKTAELYFYDSLAADHTQVPNEVGQILGVLALITHTGMLMGLTLLLVRRWVLPFGSLALIFTLNATLMASILGPTQYGLAPIMALSGLAADGLLGWLRPSAARVRALRVFAFAVPAILYTLYFVALLLTTGVEWPMPVWTGGIVLAGLVGLGLSYLLVPPSPAPPVLS